MDLSPPQCDALLDIARRAIRETLAGRAWVPERPEDPTVSQPAGCFVSLHSLESHQLRGCVGRLEADHSLYETVCEMAAGVLRDPRFSAHPVQLSELDSLELEISVLSRPRLARDPLDFELLTDGIYLMAAGETGCFLPQVARETGWNRQMLLDRLCTEKMGLAAGAWKDPSARLFIFSTLVIGPAAFNHPR
jgi:AmmeMemoRadiSam system protein A